MELPFVKMHGLGNDFVMIEDLDTTLDLSPDAVEWLCDRHFGIGGDGVILVRPATTPDADYFMLYYNADGSTAEMCGNGIRCFAKYLVDRGLIDAAEENLRVQTLGGVKHIRITRDTDGRMDLATVDMGAPILTPSEIPADFDGSQVFRCPVETKLGTFEVTAMSMGNPHAIIWVDDVDVAPVLEVGPLIETHPSFPKKTNVEFAHMAGKNHIRLRVWERGVGETLACGTGACATLVAASLACYAGREATVELPGGDLQIYWGEDGSVYMTGPATEVFSGVVMIEDRSD